MYSVAATETAVNRTLKNVFEDYNTQSQAAGEKGALVFTDDAVKSLTEAAQNKALKDVSPKTVNYINERINILGERGKYSPAEAQEAIMYLNQRLKAWYSNPSPDGYSKAYVDALIANNLRASLDIAVNSVEGGNYQWVKDSYSALKTFQKEVNHRATVVARQAPMNLIDQAANILTGAELVNALTNPSRILNAAATKGLSLWVKKINSPDYQISKMFENLDSFAQGRVLVPIPSGKEMLALSAPKSREFQTQSIEHSPIKLPEKSITTVESAVESREAARRGKTIIEARSGKKVEPPQPEFEQFTPRQQAVLEIVSELSEAEAGVRMPIESGEWIGIKSTFPDWIPAKLRNKILLDEAVEFLSSEKPKHIINPRKKRLLELLEYIDDEINRREEKYTPLPF